MAIHSGEKEDVFARLNERFGGRLRGMYFLSPRNVRIKFKWGNAPVFWTDGNVRRDEENGSIHISQFEVLALARSKTGLLSPDFEVTIYTLNKDMEKLHRSIEAIESMMFPSVENVLMDMQINRALDALLDAQTKGDETAIGQAKKSLMELQRSRIALEL